MRLRGPLGVEVEVDIGFVDDPICCQAEAMEMLRSLSAPARVYVGVGNRLGTVRERLRGVLWVRESPELARRFGELDWRAAFEPPPETPCPVRAAAVWLSIDVAVAVVLTDRDHRGRVAAADFRVADAPWPVEIRGCDRSLGNEA